MMAFEYHSYSSACPGEAGIQDLPAQPSSSQSCCDSLYFPTRVSPSFLESSPATVTPSAAVNEKDDLVAVSLCSVRSGF